jgi:hypothetical protein
MSLACFSTEGFKPFEESSADPEYTKPEQIHFLKILFSELITRERTNIVLRSSNWLGMFVAPCKLMV